MREAPYQVDGLFASEPVENETTADAGQRNKKITTTLDEQTTITIKPHIEPTEGEERGAEIKKRNWAREQQARNNDK